MEVTVREAVLMSGYSRAQIYNLIWNRRLKVRRELSKGLLINLIDRQSLIDYLKARGRKVNEQATSL